MMSRQPPARRDAFRHFMALQTRWHDNDLYGHMNNTVHYKLFDTVVNGWLIESGFLDLKAPETIGLVVETSCRFHGELAYPDTVHAGLMVEHLGTSSVAFRIGLFRNEAEEAAAEGRFVHVYVDPVSRRPRPLDAGRRALLARLQ